MQSQTEHALSQFLVRRNLHGARYSRVLKEAAVAAAAGAAVVGVAAAARVAGGEVHALVARGDAQAVVERLRGAERPAAAWSAREIDEMMGVNWR